MTILRNTLIALWLTLAAAGACAQTQPLLGRDYIRLDPPRQVSSGDKIEIIEFFYYGCPVCYELEPALSRWFLDAADSVALRRVPALASDSWESFAKLFYALEAMDQLARLHWRVYDDFHFNGLRLNEETVMAGWVSQNGLDKQNFIDTYHSPETQAKLAAARDMTRSYEIKGVPSVVVDGKFLSSARLAGGTRELIRIIEHLLELARKERWN